MFLAASCKTGRKLWSKSLLLGSGCLSPMLIAPLLSPPATIGTADDRRPSSNSWSTNAYFCCATIWNSLRSSRRSHWVLSVNRLNLVFLKYSSSSAAGRCAKRTRYRPLNPPALIQLTVCRNADPSEADPTTDRVAMGRKRRHLVFLTAGPVFQKLDQAR
jgi:hypothetical protein